VLCAQAYSPDVRIAIAVLVCICVATVSSAQSSENVAVVINDNSIQSRTIGEYYAAKRDIPAANIFRIRTSLDESVDRNTFDASIESPLRTLISTRGLQDRVLYIVLTKGVPLRITGSTGQFWTAASVDSELTLLYRRMAGSYVSLIGHVDNPYFVGKGDVASAKPFTHHDHDIVLVSRLDGASVDDVLALIDRAAAPSPEAVRQLLSGAATPRVPVADRFAAGSIAATAQAYRATSFGGSSPKVGPRSLAPPRLSTAVEVADLVHQGATAAAGETRQDVPGNPTHTDILLPAYLGGANAVEAFYLAMPYLSANTVIIGDPLCAPFRTRTLTERDIEAGVDPDSSLPSLFAERRVAALRADLPYVPRPAVALFLRAVLQVDLGERDRARTALEQATTIAPQFATAQLTLASLLVAEGEYDLAVDRYKRTLDAQPPAAREEMIEVSGGANRAGVRGVALNNLAYLLAVVLHKPAEALPFAAKAVAQRPDDPSYADTLSWVEFLVGDTANAAIHIRAALRGPSASVHLHAAAIFAATGARAQAEAHLKEALRLQPDLDSSSETAAILTRLQVESAPATP
jgi:Tfp pilus assembly protein PilF